MKSVLLVEDDKKIALAYGMRLKSMGYTVHTASDAVTAVMQARNHEPDVILLDVGLPGGDGFLVAERLQNMIQTVATPLIFITASKKPGLRERAREVGAVTLLEKPVTATAIADAIESALCASIAE